jgi:hypothetical protein
MPQLEQCKLVPRCANSMRDQKPRLRKFACLAAIAAMLMKEIAEDQSLRATGTVVEVDHPTRGKYVSVGNPIKLSDSPSEVTRSPLLGEHTDEILRQVLGFSDHQVAEIHDSGALDPPRKQAAEKPVCTQNTKAARFQRPFAIWNAIFANFAAMQTANCCYANKPVVAGIWYT